jgi:hypothetical protein
VPWPFRREERLTVPQRQARLTGPSSGLNPKVPASASSSPCPGVVIAAASRLVKRRGANGKARRQGGCRHRRYERYGHGLDYEAPIVRKDSGIACGNNSANTLNRYDDPVPRPIRVNSYAPGLSRKRMKTFTPHGRSP